MGALADARRAEPLAAGSSARAGQLA